MLTANILQTDVVKFELTFIPASQWLTGVDNDSASTLGEDGGICTLTNNAASTKFWTPAMTDIWYKCDLPSPAPTWGTSTNPNKCAIQTGLASAWNTDTVQTELSSTNNWTAPKVDDDYQNPWCTPATDGSVYSPFACKKI